MNREFISEKETIIEALEDIDSFVTKMTQFQINHPEYEYDIKINKVINERSINKWVVNLKIIKNEKQENIRVS